MSIHPRFAESILRGEKLVEFRRRPLARPTTHIVIYATDPTRAVVGVAEVGRVESGTPSMLWKTFASVAGIARYDFFAYFRGTDEGFAYVLSRVRACPAPLILGRGGLPTRAPQAFQYLDTRTLDAVIHNCAPSVTDRAG